MAAIDLVFNRPFKTGNPVNLIFGDEAASGWAEVTGVNVWNGTAWLNKPLLRFNGEFWEPATIKVWVPLP